jgi:hypothetical protein
MSSKQFSAAICWKGEQLLLHCLCCQTHWKLKVGYLPQVHSFFSRRCFEKETCPAEADKSATTSQPEVPAACAREHVAFLHHAQRSVAE